MAYINSSVKDLIDSLEMGQYVLPAIQRSFVWDEAQICALFDSLMKDYPVGSFLFWSISRDEFSEFVFRSFTKDVDKRAGSPLGNNVIDSYGDVRIGVLDGQQRITSLYVGLKGSYTSRVKKALKVNGEDPKRFLALNLLHTVDKEGEGDYQFAFLAESKIGITDCSVPGEEEHWFKVGDILDFEPEAIINYSMNHLSYEMVDNRADRYSVLLAKMQGSLTRLQKALTTETLSYFKTSKRLTDVVKIFERVNNRGQRVTGADLMLSMASAQAGMDMQVMISNAIEKVKGAATSGVAFVPEKNFVLTAALMAINADNLSTTKSENYQFARIQMINDAWDDVVTAICNAVIYVDCLGFNGSKIKASYMLPITYYFYCLGPGIDARKRYVNPKTVAEKNDLVAIGEWLLRAQVKQIFIEGSGSSLKKIRNEIRDALAESKNDGFPLAKLRASSEETRISLEITEDDVHTMLDFTPSHAATLPLLMVINGGVRNEVYEIDHVWPRNHMDAKGKVLRTIPEDKCDDIDVEFFTKNYNKLANLELLEKTINASKGDELFDIWLSNRFADDEPSRIYYLKKIGIPEDEDLDFCKFKEVYLGRRAELTKRIREYFGVMERDTLS